MKVRDGKRLKLEMVDIYSSGTYNHTIYFAYESNHVTVISHLTQYFMTTSYHKIGNILLY